MQHVVRRTTAAMLLAALVVSVPSSSALAFWVVNFGTAGTLAPGRVGFAAGLGGQVVIVGDEALIPNAFFFIPHAGLRVGLAEPLDMGLRLAPVPLPYSTVGPGFGANVDLKLRLTAADSDVGFALVAGIGAAHVLILDQSRFAWSPNGAALLSFRLDPNVDMTFMGRYVYLAIPTAMGGMEQNFVHISGLSWGFRIGIADHISLLPEVGAYWYEGSVNGGRMSGPGFQYGIMLGTSF